MTRKNVEVPERDELASVLADSLNNLVDGGKVAYFLDGKEDTPTDLDDWVSTGSTMLDIAISNRANGGLPVGRIIELTGLEGSGKSLLCAHVIANTQKQGGIGLFIDTESALNEEFYRAVGVDMKKFLYVNHEALEDIFDMVVDIIEKVRKTSKNKLVTIVVDSVSASSTKAELESKFSKDGYATDKAIIISKAMRKITSLIAKQRILLIFTNQLRQKMNAMPFGDQYTTSGGMGIRYHSSVRLRLNQIGKIKNKAGDVVGTKVKTQVVKNRCGPPHREADFEIYFDRGIDDYTAWLSALKEFKLIKQSGAWYSYVHTTTGEEFKFQAKDFPSFLEQDESRKTMLYEQLCQNMIMSYRTTDSENTFSFEETEEE